MLAMVQSPHATFVLEMSLVYSVAPAEPAPGFSE